jgi:formylglycine-generating enzyme required for sulfatase activity
MEELFTAQAGTSLSEEVYDNVGGIAGGIRTHVEAVEEQVARQYGGDAQAWLPKIFQPLVVVNLDGQPTRCRVLKARYSSDLLPVIDLLIKERLLSTEGEGQQSTVSVAHEKLFETWPSLTRWVAQNRDDLFVLRQAEIEAKEWSKHDFDIKYLWHIDRLQRLRDISQRGDTEGFEVSIKDYITPQHRLIERLDRHVLSHQERLSIGQYLDALGDPRPGTRLSADGVPAIDWIDIPAGKVKMEGQKKVFAVKPFRISRYLVTNIQFESFVNADDGYRNPIWWADIEQSEPPDFSRWRENNAPRADVSWFDAIAFCRWLSARTGRKVRLPTEWEWQQAATGGDARKNYPWGPEWDPTRCNSHESNLERTTTVGVYPTGATKQGVLDIAGNVWEWCLNRYDNPDRKEALRIDSDERGQRAMRGGSWDNEPRYLCSSLRYGYYAGYRSLNVRFRLAQDLGN